MRLALALAIVVALAAPARATTLATPARATTLAALVARCAPAVAPRTALAVIAVESAGRWWAINDNDRPTPAFRTPGEAIAYARWRIAQGASVDLGLTQLNSAHLAAMHVSVERAFEPCTNVALGMAVLQAAWAQAQRRYGRTKAALLRAFEAYNGGAGAWTTDDPGLRARVARYADAVWATAAAIALPARPPRPLPTSARRARVVFRGAS